MSMRHGSPSKILSRLDGRFALSSLVLASLLSGVSASSAVAQMTGKVAVAAPPAPRAVSAASGTVISAHDGQFWLGSQTKLFHGVGVGDGDAATLDRVASWNMNFGRSSSDWARLEPNPPVKQQNGTWVHTYDMNYLSKIKTMLRDAAARGIWIMVGNGACREDDDDTKPACNPVGWPSWLFTSNYNTYGRNYDLKTDDGQTAAMTNFWSDPLQKQFMTDQWKFVASQLKDLSGIAGVQIMNEPHKGLLPSEHSTTQLILDFEVSVGRAIRSVDPNRVLIFSTRTGFLPGLPNADLTGVASLGNAGFDLHNYFGARWGGGLAKGASNFGEAKQNQYNSTLSGVPYFGTTYGQIRFLQTYLNVLQPFGFPLIVGEFGDANADPAIMNYFGTTTSAFNQMRVSWNVHNNIMGTGSPDDWSLLYQNGQETPWLTQIIKPAAAFTG